MAGSDQTTPRASLSVYDGIAIIVGIVVGIGIFKTPQLVAVNVASEQAFIGLWIAGGIVTLIGALVYAELGSTYPSTGGEYHFLARALGRSTGFLFAWARITVIQTGAIAAVAFVFGDYAQQLGPLGAFGSSIYAGLTVLAFTLVNAIGTYQSKTAQNIFTALTLAAILAIVVAGFTAAGATPSAPSPSIEPSAGAAGLAMIFILLTYGGWNEAAYLSGEIRDVRRNMIRVLTIGTAVIMVLYTLINLAYLQVLGFAGLRASDAVAADMMRIALGENGARILSLVICCAALSTLNATIFTGARVYHALAADQTALRAFGSWDARGNNPRNAVLVQGGIALALVLFGALTRDGFQAMVEYTAPVFWFFLLLVGVSFFVLRYREPQRARPFQVPLHPLVPLLFCGICAYLLYSSLAYTGLGAMVGVTVLLLGVPVLIFVRSRQPLAPAE